MIQEGLHSIGSQIPRMPHAMKSDKPLVPCHIRFLCPAGQSPAADLGADRFLQLAWFGHMEILTGIIFIFH